MPPTGRGRTRAGRTLALVLLGTGLVACSGGPPRDGPPPTASRVPPDVVRGLTRALERRAGAVRRDDAEAFAGGLAPGPQFRRDQRTYLANLAQLPLARFAYHLDPGSLVREGDDYWVVVRLTMQLDGFDAVPVTTRDRFRFSPAPGEPGRYRLASVTDRAWEAARELRPMPWDSGPIHVRTGLGVLGVFDADSVAHADGVVASVERGIASVAPEVPYPWSRSVVVYALSDTGFLSTVPDLPGGDPERLDGVAFPVTSTPDGGRVASTRFVLGPAMLERDGAQRDRLVRHELTHVAVGEHDDRAPVWLSEGLAEYVSVRPLAPEARLIPEEAVTAARRGWGGLPEDRTFNDLDSAQHYALAWWVCEYVADGYGEPTLWSLLDALDEDGADQERVLRARLGLGADELARRAAGLIVATFDPASLEPAGPPQGPGATARPGDDESGSASESGSPSGSPTP